MSRSVTDEGIPGSMKKKAKVTTNTHDAKAGKWHKTSFTFDDDVGTIDLDEVN
ncbi:MAG: hypothetical protein QF918_08580 [Pirellulaceae bacterium]|jgi:1,2-phenylacetyl-CoA epoxidase PaaB subunit|nr:hypothetical protein [Pirellulaceae bacterium]